MTFPPSRLFTGFAAKLRVCLASFSHSFFEFVGVLKAVLAWRHSLKITTLIIRFNPVAVMNNLIRCQQSAIGLFPLKPMFEDITSAVGVRVIGFMNSDIPAAKGTSSFPVWAMTRSLPCSVMAWNIRQRVASKVSQFACRFPRGRSELAASTFAYSRWYLFRSWGIAIGRIVRYDWFSHAVDSLSVNGWSGSLGRRNLSCGPLVFYHDLQFQGGV